MWPFPPIQNERVLLYITTQEILCAWINSRKDKQLVLKKYLKLPLHTIHPAAIAKELKPFISANNLSHSLLSISLAAPLLHEEFIRLPHASPLPRDFVMAPLEKMLWDYRYLHTLDDGYHLFYVCGISLPELFSYQLLAHAMNLRITTITSVYASLAQAYRALYGPAFRRSQMAIDMITNKYQLQNSISTDTIARLLYISPELQVNVLQDKVALLSMIGLCYQESET